MNSKSFFALVLLFTVLLGSKYFSDSESNKDTENLVQTSPVPPPILKSIESSKVPTIKNSPKTFVTESKREVVESQVKDFVLPSSKDAVDSQKNAPNLKQNQGPWVSSLSGSESQRYFINKKQREKCTTEDCAYKKGEPIQLVGVKVETSQGRPAKDDWIDGDLEVGNGAKDPVLFVD